MITVQEAHRLIQESLPAPGIEEQLLRHLQGMVLARDVEAPFALPRFTNAAMDGFAVRWDDISHASVDSPVLLHVTQIIPAGRSSTMRVVSGCSAEIMTGAPLPEGADTVVAFENTSGFGSAFVEIYRPVQKGANVRHSGEEVKPGEVLLHKGDILSLPEIALLASFGLSSAEVYRKPRVAMLTVGDELRMPGEAVSGAEIYNSNLFMLEAACRSVGIEPVALSAAPDTRDSLHAELVGLLEACDLLITVGGISTGAYDFVQQELAVLGVQKKFWSVAQKPGKPLYFGCSESGIPVFSLPGSPVSALVCFVEYCIPALSALQGRAAPAKLRAILAEPFPSDKKRYRFLPGHLYPEEGRLRCRISEQVESHMLTSLIGSNALLEAEPSREPLPAGSEILCTLFPWSGFL